MTLKLRIRSLRGVYCWIAEYDGAVELVGPVREWPLAEIMFAVIRAPSR